MIKIRGAEVSFLLPTHPRSPFTSLIELKYKDYTQRYRYVITFYTQQGSNGARSESRNICYGRGGQLVK